MKPSADVYAAAATPVNLLTGQMVYDSPGHAQLMLLKILEEDPVPFRQRRLDLLEELARDPRQRFADAKALRDALRPFAS